MLCFFSQQVRGISVVQFIGTVADVALAQVPGTELKLLLCLWCWTVNIGCAQLFLQKVRFTTASVYHIYSENKNRKPTVLLWCLCFPRREVLYLYTRQLQLGWAPLLGHGLVFNSLSELSGAGLVRSCLEKEGSSLPQVTETECGDLSWGWNGSFTAVST